MVAGGGAERHPRYTEERWTYPGRGAGALRVINNPVFK
jgi:hypothetical protein